MRARDIDRHTKQLTLFATVALVVLVCITLNVFFPSKPFSYESELRQMQNQSPSGPVTTNGGP